MRWKECQNKLLEIIPIPYVCSTFYVRNSHVYQHIQFRFSNRVDAILLFLHIDSIHKVRLYTQIQYTFYWFCSQAFFCSFIHMHSHRMVREFCTLKNRRKKTNFQRFQSLHFLIGMVYGSIPDKVIQMQLCSNGEISMKNSMW